MKTLLLCTVLLALVVPAIASNITTQTVTYSVSAINELAVSADPAALNITSTTAGSNPASVQDATTTYNISTNGTNKKITGAINTAMASGLTLQVALAAPTGGTSAGTVTLTASAANLVTGITTLAESSKTITYTFSATMAAGVVSSSNKTVTLTLTDGS